MVQDYPDWTKVLAFVGQDDDGNLVLIHVESTGQLQVLMKGLYLGELRTVALDDQGYLAAYVLDDESQWGDVVKVGNAELAARLGSPAWWDWRGKVVLCWDFADGLGPITVEHAGTGSSAELDPTRFYSGGYSVKLVGGSDGTHSATAKVELSIPPTGLLGGQIRWAESANMESLSMELYLTKDEELWIAVLKYVQATRKLQYLDSAGVYQDIVTLSHSVAVNLFTNLKLVVNMDTGKYVRVLIEGHEYPLTADVYYDDATGTADWFVMSCYIKSRDGQNDYVYLDSMIATVGETE